MERCSTPGPSGISLQQQPRNWFTAKGNKTLDSKHNIAAFALDEFDNRDKHLRKKDRFRVENFDDWKKAVYFAYREEPINLDDSGYKKFLGRIQEVREARQRQEELERQQQSSDTGDIYKELGLGSSDDEPKFASGYGLKTGSGCIASPNNIVDDVSRLEVLIGGKRAGNNSPEIINEAAGIC